MKRIVVFTGAGVSADSGLATFRDSDGLWADYRIEDVCTPEALAHNRATVIEFYNKRRREMLAARPNAAHLAIAGLEADFDVEVITQNVDDLHERAGSTRVTHLHGELRKLRSSRDPALIVPIEGWEQPLDATAPDGVLLRPHIVFFGEAVPQFDHAARIAAAFFALCPYHAVFASNFTKDVLFAAFLAVFVAYTLEYVQAGGLCARRMAMCVFAGMMACLLRNNMIYAMLVWVALLLVFGRGMRRAACWALLAAGLGMGANQALAALTHADSGDAKEMLSVPAQQLSRVYTLAPETFTDEEMVAMDTYFGNEGYTRYDATLADFTKNDLSTDVILEDKAGFFKLWLTIGQRRPDLYLDALLELDLPFLYPYRAYAGTAKYIETGMSPRALTMPFGGDDMIQPARFKGVRDWLDEHIWSTGARDVPALRWVFNAGVVIWLMLLSALFAMYTGNWKRFGILLLPILLWGTYLLGPVMQGRYLYPFICLLPLMLAVCKTKEE